MPATLCRRRSRATLKSATAKSTQTLGCLKAANLKIRRASTLLNRDETIKRFGIELFWVPVPGSSMGGIRAKIDPEWLSLIGARNLPAQYGPTDHFSSINGVHSGTHLGVESVGNVALETAVGGPLKQSLYVATAASGFLRANSPARMPTTLAPLISTDWFWRARAGQR